jgi:hypothetical protein
MVSGVDKIGLHAGNSIARFAHLVKEARFLDFTTNSVYYDVCVHALVRKSKIQTQRFHFFPVRSRVVLAQDSHGATLILLHD